MDYEKIVKAIIDPIVEDSDSVLLRVNEEEKDVLIIIAAEKDDTARLIGRKGIIANAIREVVSVAGKSEEKHVHLKFESFDDEKKEDQSSFLLIMEYLLLGYIIDSFSLDGTVKILSKTDFADLRYQKGNAIFFYNTKAKERLPMTVVSYRSNGQFDFVKVEEINSPEEAQTYKGFEVQVEKDYKNMDKDTYYFVDIVGCEVLDENGQVLGVVSQVEEFPAQLTLRVKRKGQSDFLVPFVKAFIRSVDIENKKIVINVIGGLL